MAELVSKFQELQRLPQELHWFCELWTPLKTLAPTQPPSDIEHRLGSDVRLRGDQGAECLLLYTYGDAIEYQERLTLLVDLQLGRCDVCVEEYYKARKRLDERLRHDYDEENVDAVVKTIDEQDFRRINRGLDNANGVLQKLEPSKRHKNMLKIHTQLAMFEALCNEAYLLDHKILDDHFQAPFKLVQTNKRLNIARYSPAATAFLFHLDQERCEWAMQTWFKYRQSPTKEEFEYAIKGPLVRHLQSISQFVPDEPTLQRTWYGIGLIVSNLDNNLVTHSLRALDIDVFKLALDHLRFDASSFRSLVETIQKLLEVAPKDFWDSMGAISPTTFVEQIFNNAQYDRFIEQSNPSDVEEASPLRDLLSWVKPFMSSLDTAHQAGVCRALSFQLLQRLQHDRFPEYARVECYRTGLAALAWTLGNLNKDSSFSSTGRIIAKDVLDVVGDFMDEIAGIPSRPSGLLKAWCSEISLRIVKLALALECKSVRTDQESVKQMKTPQDLPAGYGTYVNPIWEAIVRNLDPGSIDLARSVLVGMNDLTGYDKFKVNPDEPHAKEKSAYNIKLGRLTHLVCQLLERINDFTPQDLDQLYQSSESATALVSSLLAADSNLFEAGVNLIKSVSGELARREAIGHLLHTSTETTLNAFSWAIHRIARNKSYAPCPRMLKTSSDVIGVLCNSQDGLLRTMETFSAGKFKALETFWQYQWEGLQTIYEMTEIWGRHKVEDHSTLKEFCRDTMQASERLFDQYSVFANSFQLSNRMKSEQDDSPPSNINMELLRYPAATMQPMVRFLRLRDIFLVEIAVNLTKKVLNRLTELNRTVEEGTSKFLEQIILGGPQGRSHLKAQEKAELARALEANLGRPIIQAMDADSETASDQNHASSPAFQKPKPKTKSAPIDLDAWKAKAKSADAKSARQVVEVSDEDEYGSYDVLDLELQSASHSAEKDQQAFRAVTNRALPVHKKSVEPGKQSRLVHKPMRPVRSEAEQSSFREKRRQEMEASRKRNAESLAMIKKKAGVGAQVPGQGSALNGIGVRGKEHAPLGPSMMLSSESESEAEDDQDEEILGPPKTGKVSNAVKEYQAGKLKAQKGPVKKTKHVRSAKDMRARLAPDLTRLQKDILSWDYFHKGDFPPSSQRQDYRLVTNSFNTPIDYQSTFDPLLMLEAWQQFLQCREDGSFRVFEAKVTSRMTVDNFSEISTTMAANELKDVGLGEADIILLSKGKSPANDATEPHCFARVQKTTRRKATVDIIYRVNIGNGLVESMYPNATLYCSRILSITPLEREYGALQGLQYYDLCDEITRARPSPLLEYSEKQLTPLIDGYQINVAQAKAVRSAVDNDAFTLIQGPPGSGKTKTIIAIVGALLTSALGVQGQAIAQPMMNTLSRSNAGATKKLLVCAPSNAAVDELVMRLKQGVKTTQGEHKTLSVVRLGRSDAINANVMDVTLEELVNAKLSTASDKTPTPGDDLGALMTAHKATCEEFKSLRGTVDALKASGKPVSPEQNRDIEVLKRKMDQLSKQIDTARDSGDIKARNAEINRRQVQQEILDGAHVICATLSGSGHDMFQKLNIEFETVVIDEAAQSIELSALIPLKYGCSKCVLVGDPKQLPPTVLSREAARFQFEQSLFVRMQENHPNDVHLLDIQYRMHPDISLFPSKAFYDGRLVDGPHMARQRAKPWHESKVLGPYRFFDIQGFHQSVTRGHSLINLAEIDVALKLYHRLTTDCKGYDFKGKIGIITPYKSQLRELRSRFAQRHGDEILTSVEFNTTDAFQGRESEVIIFSCVRASLTKGIGFLSDIRRMNVGITRAKSSLWLLGNSHSLMKGEFWGRLIEDAKKRDVYTTGDLNSLLQKPFITKSQEPNVSQQRPLPAAHTSMEASDIRMPEAPPIERRVTSRPSSPQYETPAHVLNRPESNRASGGGNGLNESLNCRICGSFTHQTYHCDNVEALDTAGGRCWRCGRLGHSWPSCNAERCLTCGNIGHLQERCTSTKVLSNRERQVLGRKENELKKAKAHLPELHRKRQLGDHDIRPPVVQTTPETSSAKDSRKRKWSGSPLLDAPRGPKLSNAAAAHAKPESSSIEERRKRKWNGSPPHGEPKGPKQASASTAQAKAASRTSNSNSPPLSRNGDSEQSQHHGKGPMPVGLAFSGHQNHASVTITKTASSMNGGQNNPRPNETMDPSNSSSVPNISPRTIIKVGNAQPASHALPNRPPQPGPGIVKPPKKKKKDTDIFIKPRRR